MTSTNRDVILHKIGREHGEGYENELDRRARYLWTSSFMETRSYEPYGGAGPPSKFIQLDSFPNSLFRGEEVDWPCCRV